MFREKSFPISDCKWPKLCYQILSTAVFQIGKASVYDPKGVEKGSFIGLHKLELCQWDCYRTEVISLSIPKMD